MNFKMKSVSTAVAVGLGASVVGINAAHSDEILFPQIVSSPSVTTIVSVVNQTESLDLQLLTGIIDERLHYRYFFKSGAGSVPSNTAACQEINFLRTTSPNDVVTFSVDNRFGAESLGVLFEPPARQINANYTAANLSFAGLRNIDQPIRAFLVVDNLAFGAFPDDTLYGEAIILEFGSGAAWGYRAYNPDTDEVFNFEDDVETAGEVLFGQTPVQILPFIEEDGEFNTRFFVTPVSDFQLRGDLTTTIELNVFDTLAGFNVMYDRDENPVSGRVPQTVVCVGAVNAATLLTQGARGEVPFGGWSNLNVLDPGAGTNQVDQAIVFKLEFNQEQGGTFTGEALPGVFNNAIWLRKGHRESIQLQ